MTTISLVLCLSKPCFFTSIFRILAQLSSEIADSTAVNQILNEAAALDEQKVLDLEQALASGLSSETAASTATLGQPGINGDAADPPSFSSPLGTPGLAEPELPSPEIPNSGAADPVGFLMPNQTTDEDTEPLRPSGTVDRIRLEDYELSWTPHPIGNFLEILRAWEAADSQTSE